MSIARKAPSLQMNLLLRQKEVKPPLLVSQKQVAKKLRALGSRSIRYTHPYSISSMRMAFQQQKRTKYRLPVRMDDS